MESSNAPQPLRVVLVGCGRISAVWLRNAANMPDITIVGLVDLNLEMAQARAKEFELSHAIVSNDLEAVLAQTQPELVFICSAPASHAPIAITALQAGCHVLTEKPLADSLEAAQAMIAAAEQAGRLLAVTQNRRYDRGVRRLRALRQADMLDTLTTVNSDHYMGNHFGGFREQMQHALLLDMAIHSFDTARCITGADAVSVYCHEWNPAGSWYAHGASAMAIFQMSNGLVYSYRGSWCSEGLNTSPQCTWRLIGQRGSATWDSFDELEAEQVVVTGGVERTGSLQSQCRAIELPPPDDEDRVHGHASILREFVRCVRTDEVPETVATDNIKSLAMVLAAIESADRGLPVAVRN